MHKSAVGDRNVSQLRRPLNDLDALSIVHHRSDVRLSPTDDLARGRVDDAARAPAPSALVLGFNVEYVAVILRGLAHDLDLPG